MFLKGVQSPEPCSAKKELSLTQYSVLMVQMEKSFGHVQSGYSGQGVSKDGSTDLGS